MLNFIIHSCCLEIVFCYFLELRKISQKIIFQESLQLLCEYFGGGGHLKNSFQILTLRSLKSRTQPAIL